MVGCGGTEEYRFNGTVLSLNYRGFRKLNLKVFSSAN